MRLGKKVMTRGIADRIAENEQFAKQVTYFMGLYINGDWGDTPEEDKEMNDLNLASGKGSLMEHTTLARDEFGS